MWLRDSTNQIISYVPYAKDDDKLKKLILGVIYMQAKLITEVKIKFTIFFFFKEFFFNSLFYRTHMRMHIMHHMKQNFLIQKIHGQKLISQLHPLQVLH